MQLSRNRIEALADGMFAVAMTLPGRTDIHWGRHRREKSKTDQDDIR